MKPAKKLKLKTKIAKGFMMPAGEFSQLKNITADGKPMPNIIHKDLESGLSNFGLALDIGANIGTFTCRYAEVFKEVHSFEPAPYMFGCLKENTKNLKNVTIHNFGIGDKEEEKTISLPMGRNFGASSFVENKKGFRQNAKIRTLDSFGFSPDFIKIDVENYEYYVLMGGKETISKAQFVQMEIWPQGKGHKKNPHHDQIMAEMNQLGFEVIHSTGSRQQDKLFKKRT